MNLAFVFCVFPPEVAPTAVMAAELVAHFAGRGDDVTVVAPFPSRPAGRIYSGYRRALFRREEFMGSTLIRVPCITIGERRRVIARILENFTFGIASAVAVVAMRRPDVVVVETWPTLASVLTLLACRFRRVPCIQYIKDLYPEAISSAGLIREGGALSKLLLLLDRVACRLASTNVVISSGMADHLRATRRLAPDHVAVIPDWIDILGIRADTPRSEWRREFGIGCGEFVALFAGTVGHASGATILADTAVLLRNDPGIRIICVGEGPLKQHLEMRKATEGLSNLTILPFQPREAVSAMHAAADVCLLTTASGMGASSVPNKLITYLAAARPVIVSAASSSEIGRTVERYNVGWVVPAGDPVALAAAIRYAANLAPQVREAIGHSARALAEMSYSKTSATERFSELLKQVSRTATGAGTAMVEG